MSENILRAFVEIRRNDNKYSFTRTMLEADKESLLNKTINLLEEQSETWILYLLEDLNPKKRIVLENCELVDAQLLTHKDAAIFIREDHQALVGINMEDHFLIRVAAQVGEEKLAMDEAKTIAQTLSLNGTYAKDERIGWLTARPQYAGTGLQVTYVLHLPMLNMMQQIKLNMTKINSGHRFLLTPLNYGDEKNPASLYYVRNLFTAYSSSEKLLLDIQAKVQEITDKEENLQKKILKYTNRTVYSDQIFRAYGILRYARRLTQSEFLNFWSKLRLGAIAGLLPVSTKLADSLISLTAKAKLIEQSDGVLDEHAIHFNRADTVREALNGGT